MTEFTTDRIAKQTLGALAFPGRCWSPQPERRSGRGAYFGAGAEPQGFPDDPEGCEGVGSTAWGESLARLLAVMSAS